jgi:hypothetical protein
MNKQNAQALIAFLLITLSLDINSSLQVGDPGQLTERQLSDYQKRLNNFAIYYKTSLHDGNLKLLSGVNAYEFNLENYTFISGDIHFSLVLCNPQDGFICLVGPKVEFGMPMGMGKKVGDSWCFNDRIYKVESVSYPGITKHTLYNSSELFLTIRAINIEDNETVTYVYNQDVGIIAMGLSFEKAENNVIYNLISKEGLLAKPRLGKFNREYISDFKVKEMRNSCNAKDVNFGG